MYAKFPFYKLALDINIKEIEQILIFKTEFWEKDLCMLVGSIHKEFLNSFEY